jgi:hypothetical protein
VRREERQSEADKGAHPIITAPSFTQYTMTSSTPASLRAPCCSRYSGTCSPDQHGVKAPGRPNRITLRPAQRSARLTLTMSLKPWSSSMLGILSPTATNAGGVAASRQRQGEASANRASNLTCGWHSAAGLRDELLARSCERL